MPQKFRGNILTQMWLIYKSNSTFASPCIIIRFKRFNQQDATVSQVYYLSFMCGSTCFGRLPARHQERTAALGVSGFTVGEKRLEHCWSWSGRLTCQTMTNNARSASLQW